MSDSPSKRERKPSFKVRTKQEEDAEKSRRAEEMMLKRRAQQEKKGNKQAARDEGQGVKRLLMGETAEK